MVSGEILYGLILELTPIVCVFLSTAKFFAVDYKKVRGRLVASVRPSVRTSVRSFSNFKIGFLGHFLSDWAEIFCEASLGSRNLG